MQGKWVRSEQGVLQNLGFFDSLSVTVGSTSSGPGYQVRAWRGDQYAILFSDPSEAVCQEWLDAFARENLDLITPIPAVTTTAPLLLETLTKLVADLDSLVADSKGVAGLHRNGDVATWGELTAGGRFEGWLSSLDDARDLLDQLNQTQSAPAPEEVIS